MAVAHFWLGELVADYEQSCETNRVWRESKDGQEVLWKPCQMRCDYGVLNCLEENHLE